MKLEEVNALVTTFDLYDVIKDGMCYSEPVLMSVKGRWVDVFFTYSINYEEKQYSGPVSVFGIDFENRQVAFKADAESFHFEKSADDIVRPEDWDEESAIYYDDYAAAYELLRQNLLTGKYQECNSKCVADYLSLLEKYVDGSLWEFYFVLTKDLRRLAQAEGGIIDV
ncbi:MAG: hypothetical protein NC121_07120 [Blautia sp.]|nr:hypothetical protein [Blautia sp.]